MFVICSILALISSACAGACVLGYFIDYPEIWALGLAIAFIALFGYYMHFALVAYKERAERKEESAE